MIPTVTQINEYHQLHEKYYLAQHRFNALMSQGRYCPADILVQARIEMLETEKAYNKFKTELWPDLSKIDHVNLILRCCFALACFMATALILTGG